MSYNKYHITKKQLEEYIKLGYSQVQMATAIGCGTTNIGHFIEKFGLRDVQINKPQPPYRFNKIDSAIKAYIIGFICCDGAINLTHSVEITVQKADKEVADFIADELNANVNISNIFDKKTKRFPRARIVKKIPDILKFIGGRLKVDRHLPIVKKEFNRYLLLGAFDADGCITWGRRKDRNRIWQKISFTTSFGIAICIQNILLKDLNISTAIKPKTGCNCYIIDFANRNDVLKFLDFIYCDDFVVLKRKYLKAKALRLELEENGEGAIKQ